MLLTWIFASSDKLTIKLFSNLNEVGLYSGAFKIISLIIIVQNGFTTFWTPVIFEHYKKYPKNTTFYKKANDYLSLVFFIFAVGILLSRNFLVILLGKKYHEALYIMPMLVFMPVMYLLSETTMVGIEFKKDKIFHIHINSGSNNKYNGKYTISTSFRCKRSSNFNRVIIYSFLCTKDLFFNKINKFWI